MILPKFDQPVRVDPGFICRAAHIERWSTVRTRRSQNIAEHQWAVAMLAMLICRRLNLPDSNACAVVQLAMVHDLDEVITGDIQSPTKNWLRTIPGVREELEALARRIDLLAEAEQDTNKFEREIVKCADLLEQIEFVRQEGQGRRATAAYRWLSARLDETLARIEAGYRYGEDLARTVQAMREEMAAKHEEEVNDRIP